MNAYFMIACLCGAAAAPIASGNVILVTQSRTVTATDGGWGRAISDAAPGFGPWHREIETRTTPYNFNRGRATQDSLITASRMVASASVFAADDVQGFVGGASSTFACDFDVAIAQDFWLTGSWSVDFHGPESGLEPIAHMRFERLSPTPLVFHDSSFRVHGNSSIRSDIANVDGTLEPGRYRLSVEVSQWAAMFYGTVEGSGRFDIELNVPGPAAWIMIAGAIGVRRRRRTSGSLFAS